MVRRILGVVVVLLYGLERLHVCVDMLDYVDRCLW